MSFLFCSFSINHHFGEIKMFSQRKVNSYSFEFRIISTLQKIAYFLYEIIQIITNFIINYIGCIQILIISLFLFF